MGSDMRTLANEFVGSARARFSHAGARLVSAIRGLTPEELAFRPNEASNTIANLVLHLCGHLRGGYLGDTGRDRAGEFLAEGPFEAPALVAHVEDTFRRMDQVLAGADAAELADPDRRDGPEGTLVASVLYSLAHTTEHVGQVILLAKAQRPEAVGHLWGTPVQRRAGAPPA